MSSREGGVTRIVRKREAKKAIRRADSELALRIMRIVPIPKSFLFFTDLGQYTGESATCLTDFCEKLGEVPLESIEFHFERGDFDKWIKGTLGDEYLAKRIVNITRSIQGEKLRATIQRIVRRRVDQLKAAKMTEM